MLRETLHGVVCIGAMAEHTCLTDKPLIATQLLILTVNKTKPIDYRGQAIDDALLEELLEGLHCQRAFIQ